MEEKNKKCKCCGKEKPRDGFYRLFGKNYKPEWDCRDSYCIPCRSTYSSNRRRIIKEKAIEHLGGKCVDCGLENAKSCVYDFHHIDPTQKDFSISNNSKSFESIKPELDKCILLCANCHRLRHNEILL